MPNIIFKRIKGKDSKKPSCNIKMNLTFSVFNTISRLKRDARSWELNILDEIMLSSDFNTKINIDKESSTYVRYVKKWQKVCCFI